MKEYGDVASSVCLGMALWHGEGVSKVGIYELQAKTRETDRQIDLAWTW